MRSHTAARIINEYRAWRGASTGSNERRVLKESLDEVIKQAIREDFVERAFAQLQVPFGYEVEWVNRGSYPAMVENWPEPGKEGDYVRSD